MNNFVDYYEFLDIKMSANFEEIKEACKKKLRENDLLSASKGSKEYQRISFMRYMTFEIYQVLSDEEARKKYDEKLVVYRKQLAKKNSYFNAYREDKKDITGMSDVDFSDEWRQILHRKGSVTEDSKKDQVAPEVGSVTANKAGKVALETETKKETNSSRGQLTGTKPVNGKTDLAKKPSASVKSTATKKSSTPVKETARSGKKMSATVKSKQTSQSTSNKTVVDVKTKQKPGKYLAVKTEPTKTDNCKKYFSNQVLSVSKAFVRGIVNLEIRKDDNFKKYVLRNKRVLGTVLAFSVIGGGLAIWNNNKEASVEENTISTESVVSTDETVENLDYTIPETKATLPKEDVITLYRVHKIVPGDTLSKLSADSNATFEEIKRVNSMSNDNVVLGKKYFIPYIIDAADLYIYTISAPYDPNLSLDEYASKYETNDATMQKLNPNAIVYVPGSGYRVITDSLLVPNFVTKSEYRDIKAAERIAQNVKK